MTEDLCCPNFLTIADNGLAIIPRARKEYFMRLEAEGEGCISVIIPTYNYGHYIKQALVSVLRQTYTNWECLVIDDGSTDDTRAVVKKYTRSDPRVRYIYQENQGQSVAINHGVRASRGSYVQILDADDLLPPEKFRRQSSYLSAHPEANLVYGGVTYFMDAPGPTASEPARKTINTMTPKAWSGDRELLMALIRHNFIAINAPLFRKSIFEEVGGFDEDRDAIADWEFWIRCAQKELGCHYLADKETYPFVRFHAASRSSDQSRFHTRIIKLRKKIQATFTDKDVLRLNQVAWAEFEGYRGIRKVTHRQIPAGLYHLAKAAWKSPGLKWKARWIYCIALLPISRQYNYEKAVTASLGRSLKNLVGMDQYR